MKHKLLIENLRKYGNISEKEESTIREVFLCVNTKKKDILINKDSLCNKLFCKSSAKSGLI